jgi:6-phosphogluconate dehydrogenase
VFDVSPNTVNELVKEGAKGSTSLAEFVSILARPRLVWLMVPAAAVAKTISDVAAYMQPGDTLIDGGNSYIVSTISAERRSCNPMALITWTSERAAESKGWSGDTV